MSEAASVGSNGTNRVGVRQQHLRRFRCRTTEDEKVLAAIGEVAQLDDRAGQVRAQSPVNGTDVSHCTDERRALSRDPNTTLR